jgi:adenylate cyclase
MSAGEQRKLAAIMFTDMVGYSALSQRDGKLALELLEEHRRLLREIFPRFNGTEIKTIGDAFLIEFHSALEAAQCAIEIQRTLAKRNHDVTSERRIELKIGIHIGDVVHREGDVYGDGVNIASRIEPLAGAGGICVSMDVERQIRNALQARFEKLARTELKNISVPMDLFRIVLPWEQQIPVAAQRRAVVALSQKPSARALVTGTIAAILLLIIGIGWWWTTLPHASRAVAQSGSIAVPAKSIAVLPFENLSSDKENAFFTDGVQDEILTDLAKVADLKVISRTSVMQYKASAPRNLSEIAQALKVANVLEGSVQRSANRVRVSAQLIDARTDTHIWAENYDRELSDVFAIQSDIAHAIADQLQAKLSPKEKATIEELPTNDLAAYDLYLKAKQLRDQDILNQSNSRENILEGIQLLNEAVARAPQFLLAHCLLARAHDAFYAYFDHTDARRSLAETSVQAAVRLQPDSGETHLAQGIHYYLGYLDYGRAREEMLKAQLALPNNAEVYAFIARIDRRQGRWDDAFRNIARAVELDPLNAEPLETLAEFYSNLRRYKEAAASYDRALRHHPTSVPLRVRRALVDRDADANLAPLRAVINTIESESQSAAGEVAEYAFDLAACERDPAAMSRAVATLARQPRENLPFPTAFCEGLIAWLRHDESAAHAAFVVARAENEQLVRMQPKNSLPLAMLAFIDASMGNKEQAIEEARAACALSPLDKDALEGALQKTNLARVYALTGERDLALQELATVSKLPGGISYGELKLYPEWDSLGRDPRFEKILASLAPKEGVQIPSK